MILLAVSTWASAGNSSQSSEMLSQQNAEEECYCSVRKRQQVEIRLEKQKEQEQE